MRSCLAARLHTQRQMMLSGFTFLERAAKGTAPALTWQEFRLGLRQISCNTGAAIAK